MLTKNWTRRAIFHRALDCTAAVTLFSSPRAFGADAFTPPVARVPLPLKVPPHVPDALHSSPPAWVSLMGWLGHRVQINATQRLARLDTAPLLAGFQHKPGSHPWIGEHVGKWLHAATLAWSNTGIPELRQRLDQVVADLVAAQEADGYLGTYTHDKRLALHNEADWDVWSHKYCLIGLLTYHLYTGSAEALQASTRAADLLLRTFPAKRSILAAGTHRGLAATSVLEPMVLLYRITGDARYLAFCRYIVAAWDEADGPHLVPTLLTQRSVHAVNPPKAYEMLSNLVGLVELTRITGEPRWLQACVAAWEDIVAHRRYLTGGTSQGEHFQADHDLQDDRSARVSETCVTTTWIQFNQALLTLTGQARYADEIERTAYNQLAGAQHTAGDDWCYFTPLSGRKPYLSDINCCHSSGPRGMALMPGLAYLQGHDGKHDVLVVNTLEPSSATVTLDGQLVRVQQISDFPYRGGSTLKLQLEKEARFALKVRAPGWAQGLHAHGAKHKDGWLMLPVRTWRNGDTLRLAYRLQSQTEVDAHGNPGRMALRWGPFVLAFDAHENPSAPAVHRLGYAQRQAQLVSRAGQPLRFFTRLVARDVTNPQQLDATLRPFADAGDTREPLRVWLRAPGRYARAPGDSLLLDGVETRSRGATLGSVVDDDVTVAASTRDGRLVQEDWFAVTLVQPQLAQRFEFVAGPVGEDGGWFDVQGGGKPRLEIRATADAPWQVLGVFADYPDTTATDARGVGNLWDWPHYRLRLSQPVRFAAVRLVGKPACGKLPTQTHVSCAELLAFAR